MSGLDVAAEALERVRAAAGPAAEAEVLVDRTELALTRFANSFIHQNVADESSVVHLRLHLDGRTTSGSTTVTTSKGLADFVERTVAVSRLCPPDPLWPGVAPPAPLAEPGLTADPETAGADPYARAARVAAFVTAAEGLEAAGYCSTRHSLVAIANSAGQAVTAETAEAAMDGIVRCKGADGVARRVVARLSDLDGAVLGDRAAAKARAGADPIELPPGRYEVVLEPTAALDLLETFAFYAFNGKALNERRSCLELGAAQFDPAITLVDDPVEAGGGGLPFDVEGTVRRRSVLVDHGVTVAVAHDRRSGRVAGVESTGHALLGGSAWGAAPTNLILQPRADAPPERDEPTGPMADSTVAALVGQVRRGLLVTDNWYTRVLDPRTLAVTGLTRNGVWLIENGEVTRPVQNMRFTQSYPQALAPGAVLGVGAYAVPLPSSWGAITMRAPALHLASWNYTGNASG